MAKMELVENGVDPITTPINSKSVGLIPWLFEHWILVVGLFFFAFLGFGLLRSCGGNKAPSPTPTVQALVSAQKLAFQEPTLTPTRQTLTPSLTATLAASQTPWIIQDVKDATPIYIDRDVTRVVPVTMYQDRVETQIVNQKVEVTRLITQLITQLVTTTPQASPTITITPTFTNTASLTPAPTYTTVPDTQTPWLILITQPPQVITQLVTVIITNTPEPPTNTPESPTFTQTVSQSPTLSATPTITPTLMDTITPSPSAAVQAYP